MTLDAFLKRLARTRRTWTWVVYPSLRTPISACPIVAVFVPPHRQASRLNWTAGGLARKAGMNYHTVSRIMNAADYPLSALSPHDQALRRRLLRACGIPRNQWQ